MTLRRTPLTEIHRTAGAKLTDFGGWEMPIEYPTGVVAEHTAVRTAVGVFDVSHMGKLVVRGPGAAAALNEILANDLDRIGAGQAQYSMLLNEGGGVLDDLIVYRLGDDELRIVPNAANAATVRDALIAALPAGIEVADRHEAEGILAIQGPQSTLALGRLNLLAQDTGLVAHKRGKRIRFMALRLLLYPTVAFLKLYLGKRYFLGGWAGYFAARTQAFYAFLKYAKVLEARRQDASAE